MTAQAHALRADGVEHDEQDGIGALRLLITRGARPDHGSGERAHGDTDQRDAHDVLREAFRVLALGADAVMTARSMEVVEMLAKEEIPVMGHLGLVPRKSTWVGGLRAVGRDGNEAFDLYQRFKRLEDAGACLVEAEVIPGQVMTEISKRTSIITVSLGSGTGGDVMYLFMEDIIGDSENPPRHARAYGNVRALRKQIEEERVKALKAFRADAMNGQFPGPAETPKIDQEEFETFLSKLD